MLLKTSIAPVLTKLPHYVPDGYVGKKQRIEPLRHPNGRPCLCWLDEMLGCPPDGAGDSESERETGLWVPHTSDGHTGRPFLLILSGPPGSAKSTLALQICYNFAESARELEVAGRPVGILDRPAALYITTETSCQQIIDKAKGFGWKEEYFSNLPDLTKPQYAGSRQESTCYVHAVAGPFAVIDVDKQHAATIKKSTMESLEDYKGNVHPQILVIDSFNTLPDFETDDRKMTDHPLNRLMRYCYNSKAMRPRVLILVLDVESGDDELTKRFRYFADATIRVDMLTDSKGMLHRTIEISKIKLQKHAAGRHAIDIMPKPPDEIANRDKSPFLNYGGVFVYPSIEWYLDFVRGSKTGSDAEIESSPRDRFSVLPADVGRVVAPGAPQLQAFFAGHTISLIGRYGILKNRLAYGSLLANVIHEHRSGLIVSLDHDKEVVTGILAGIVETEFSDRLTEFGTSLRGTDLLKRLEEPGELDFKKRLAVAYVNDLFHQDKLGFIHNEPAYITPGEFFHRVYVAFKRPRESSIEPKDHESLNPKEVTFVVVDGLDRIETKFPLCAKEPLFVSSLVTLFKIDKKACSIFISSQDPALDGAASESALIVLSDLLLRFQEPPDLDKCRGSVNDCRPVKEANEKARMCTEIHAMRVPFGLNTEPKGILWTTPSGQLRFNIPGPYDDANVDQSGHFED